MLGSSASTGLPRSLLLFIPWPVKAAGEKPILISFSSSTVGEAGGRMKPHAILLKGSDLLPPVLLQLLLLLLLLLLLPAVATANPGYPARLVRKP